MPPMLAFSDWLQSPKTTAWGLKPVALKVFGRIVIQGYWAFVERVKHSVSRKSTHATS